MRLVPALAGTSRSVRCACLLAASLGLAACPAPTDVGTEIAEKLAVELEARARSVSGPWTGTSPTLILTFQLQQAADNSVSGTGTLSDPGVPDAPPYTVSGTYQRPRLSLTFSGMTYQGRAVQGTFQGNYDQVGGVTGALQLRATEYSKDIEMLLHEPL